MARNYMTLWPLEIYFLILIKHFILYDNNIIFISCIAYLLRERDGGQLGGVKLSPDAGMARPFP